MKFYAFFKAFLARLFLAFSASFKQRSNGSNKVPSVRVHTETSDFVVNRGAVEPRRYYDKSGRLRLRPVWFYRLSENNGMPYEKTKTITV